MRKKVGIIKRVICISLVFLLSINSFAAIVSDNDGSAFITKAEFDSLKNNFQAQIDNYNSSLDSKIDGAIASYLAGIKLSTQFTLDNIYEKYVFPTDAGGTQPLKWYKVYTPEWYETIHFGLPYANYKIIQVVNDARKSQAMGLVFSTNDWDEHRSAFTDLTKQKTHLFLGHTQVGSEGVSVMTNHGQFYAMPFGRNDESNVLGVEKKQACIQEAMNNIQIGQSAYTTGPFRTDFGYFNFSDKISRFIKRHTKQIRINPINDNIISLYVPDQDWKPVLLSNLTTTDQYDYYQLGRYYPWSAKPSDNFFYQNVGGKWLSYHSGSSQMSNYSNWNKTGDPWFIKPTFNSTSHDNLTWDNYFTASSTSLMRWQAKTALESGTTLAYVDDITGIFPAGVQNPVDWAPGFDRMLSFYLYEGCYDDQKINELVIQDLYDICRANDKLKYGVAVAQNTQADGKLQISYQVSKPGKIFFYTTADQKDGKYGTSSALTPTQAFTNLGTTVSASTNYTVTLDNCMKNDWIFVMYNPNEDDATITVSDLSLTVDN